MSLAKLTQENLPRFRDRINTLRADKRPNWGTMTATGMLVHLRTLIEMSLEEGTYKDYSTFYSRNIMRFVAFHVLRTWPKGTVKAPAEFTPESTASFDDERAKLFAAFDRFADAAATTPKRVTRHSLFGPLTLNYWTFMHARHFEHHFQQFGI
ncbi:MAG: DUF1569 domain-containing protein [Candidatus Hydrogenedentes bacterium]|nr:DUF1569 domain-containing protein [Candidatus Hydrogenedentota bacterium]